MRKERAAPTEHPHPGHCGTATLLPRPGFPPEGVRTPRPSELQHTAKTRQNACRACVFPRPERSRNSRESKGNFCLPSSFGPARCGVRGRLSPPEKLFLLPLPSRRGTARCPARLSGRAPGRNSFDFFMNVTEKHPFPIEITGKNLYCNIRSAKRRPERGKT